MATDYPGIAVKDQVGGVDHDKAEDGGCGDEDDEQDEVAVLAGQHRIGVARCMRNMGMFRWSGG